MNQQKPHPSDDLQPLDAFERDWIDQLAAPEQDLTQRSDDFVQAVMDRHHAQQNPPSIAGRIGFGSMPYAAAAALLIAALVGWYLLTVNPSLTSQPDLATQDQDTAEPTDEQTPQPTDPSPVAPVDPTKIQLGKLIDQTQFALTQPATSLTTSLRDTPQAIQLQRLLELIENPVPNLKELLAPLDQSKQQSRA